MEREIEKYLISLRLNEGVENDLIKQTEKAFDISFPLDYREFMLKYNGCEGEIKDSYIYLWKIEDIIDLNEAYSVNEFADGLILIGSDGGDTAYAFDARGNMMPIIEVPFIGMDIDKIKLCAETFCGFLDYLHNK